MCLLKLFQNNYLVITFFKVPFGPLAFMPGKLVHTNEILVLLGDNWFVDRSAKQACEIIDRRVKCKHPSIKTFL